MLLSGLYLLEPRNVSPMLTAWFFEEFSDMCDVSFFSTSVVLFITLFRPECVGIIDTSSGLLEAIMVKFAFLGKKGTFTVVY